MDNLSIPNMKKESLITAHILMVEDDEIERSKILLHFETEQLLYKFSFASSVSEAKEKNETIEFDILLIDVNLPDGTGLEIQAQNDTTPCIYLFGVSDIDIVVQVMKAGAFSYFIKDEERKYLKLLDIAIQHALVKKQKDDELVRYRTQLEAEVQLRTSEMKEINDDLIAENKERILAEEKTRRHLTFLNALRDIDDLISSSIDLNLTLNILLRHTVSQLNVDAAMFFLLDKDLLQLSYKAGIGFKDTTDFQNTDIKIGESFAGKIALNQEILVTNFKGETLHPKLKKVVEIEGFESYGGAPLLAKGQIIGVLEIYKHDEIIPSSDWRSYFEALANQAAIAIDNFQLFNELQKSNLELSLGYDQTIVGWSKTLEMRDDETEGHSQRVADLTVKLARAMGVDADELVHFRRGALLHDIGKMNIPDAILLKPGKFNDEEWGIMKMHTEYAYEFLSPISFLKPALDIPRYHHEKWDGSGYQAELKGTQIPLAARVFAVVDVYDALLSDRPYRKAWPKEKIIDHIKSQSGSHFDPEIVDTFIKLIK